MNLSHQDTDHQENALVMECGPGHSHFYSQFVVYYILVGGWWWPMMNLTCALEKTDLLHL